MMILLNGHSLTVKNRFMPEKLALQISERQSTATMIIGPEAPGMNVGDWLQCEEGPAKGVVWRVKTIDQQYDKDTRTVTLEHIIQSLKDMVLFGDHGPKEITGDKKATTATAKQTVQYILSKQSDWTLNNFDYTVSNPYSFNGDDLFSALETVSSSLEDCIWEYSFTSYPFRISIRKLDDTLGTEMRTDRNIKTLKKTIDRSRMYTRIYPIGKNNLHISGNYLHKNDGTYGVICKVETESSMDTEAKLKAWAQQRLNRHCEPSVTVSISGMDLKEATGEPLDTFKIGTYCQVPLPEFSTTIKERVTKLSYTDVINSPMDVTVTLANELQDVATILRQQQSSSGGGARQKAKDDEEDHAWFVDTTTHVAMVAEAVAGPGADKDWSRVSRVIVDGQGIHQQVTTTRNDLERAESKIDVQEGKISLVVEEKNGQNVVKAASIVAGINAQTGSYLKLEADKIDLSGYVTATQLNSVDARIDNLKAGNEIATKIQSASLIGAVVQATQSISVTSSATVYIWGHQCSFYTVNVNGTDRHLLGY